MRNLKLIFTALTFSLLLYIFSGSNSVVAQDGDWDWYYEDTTGYELPCDSLIQFECNGETLEYSLCEIDWQALEDCFWDDDDWDWYTDSIDYGDWDYGDWNWYYEDTTGYELPCDSLIQFECNGETLEYSLCEIDWQALEDCFWDNYDDDWDWYTDSIDYGDWDYGDWNWYYGDTTGYELPCDSLIQFECNGETLEYSLCEIDWQALEDCFWDNYDDDWDWYTDSIDYDDWDYGDWNWYYGDTTGYELPCDSLIQFECNGETLEYSLCEIDWQVLEDCVSTLLEEDDNNPLQDVIPGEIEPSQTNRDKDDIYNTVVNEIYPNPLIGDLYVNITTYQPGSIDIIIADVKGGVVYEEEDIELPGGGKYVHSISFKTKLPMGMYMLNVISENQQILKTQNLIIEN